MIVFVLSETELVEEYLEKGDRYNKDWLELV